MGLFKIRSLSVRLFLMILVAILPLLVLMIYNALKDHSDPSLLFFDLLVSGIVLLLSLAVSRLSGIWLVMRLVEPLLKTAHRLEQGDLSARSVIPNDGTDLGRLAHTFDQMAAALEQRTKDLHLALDKYRNLFNRSPIGLYRTSPEGILLDANPSMYRMLGINEPELPASIDINRFYIQPSDRKYWQEIIASRGVLIDHELSLRRLDNQIIYTLDNAIAIYDSVGKVVCYEGSLQDITNRKSMEASLKEANQKLSMVLNSIAEAYVVLDDQWRFLEVNQVAVQEIFGGRPAEELLGKVFWEEYPQAMETEFYRQYQIAITECHPVHFEAESKINGRWWETHAYPYPNRLEAYLRDITERKSVEASMSRLAYHDPLTGLLNRKAFQEEMAKSQARVERMGNRLAVYFIDLDNFKSINDQFGHDFGDMTLMMVADRLRSAIRNEDVLSRLGGDEFTFMAEIAQVENAIQIAERVMKAFEVPVQINEVSIRVSLSVGISIYPDHAEDTEMLIKLADHAMYIVKRAGKGNFHFSSGDLKGTG